MPAIRSSWLTAAALALSSALPGQDQGGPKTAPRIAVRLLPTDNEALRAELIRDLSAIGAPERVTVPMGSTLEGFIRDRCGFNTDELTHVVRTANPGLVVEAGAPWPRAQEIKLPPCPRWEFNRRIAVTKGGAAGVRSSMQQWMGFSGPATEADFRRVNPDLASLASVTAGQKVTMPYVALPITVHLQDAQADFAAAIASFERKYARQIVGGIVVESSPIEIEKEVVPAAAGDVCAMPPVAGQPWPFDRSELLDILRLHPADRQPRRGAVVMVADTGVARDDLSRLPIRENRFEAGDLETDGKDNDGSGFKDDRYGANMDPPGGFPALDPGYSRARHGTHVAGMVVGGAFDDELRAELETRVSVGVANIVKATQFANSPRYWEISTAAIQGSIRYAKSTRASVLNWSFQSSEEMPNVEESLGAADLPLVVIAAGNDGAALGERSSFPASYAAVHKLSERLLTVAAHAPNGAVTGFSNWGTEVVDLAAPGCGLTTVDVRTGTAIVAGTSFAAPLVSMTAALLAARGLERPAEIKTRLMATVQLDDALAHKVRWSGRLDIAKALPFDQDVLEPRVRAPGSSRLKVGQIQAPKGEWRLCDRRVPVGDILRIVPRRKRGSKPTWVLFRAFDSVGRPIGTREEYCGLPELEIQFRPAGTRSTETLKVSELRDIVPSWSPGSDGRPR
jgi:hypothetical protein